uniref:Uncharacterized protein n=1 Tax=Arion vulgaris TaxID=1028688 RepID=A0A0B7APC3_9EUPU
MSLTNDVRIPCFTGHKISPFLMTLTATFDLVYSLLLVVTVWNKSGQNEQKVSTFKHDFL